MLNSDQVLSGFVARPIKLLMVVSDIWLQCQLQERILETIQQNVGSSHYHTL